MEKQKVSNYPAPENVKDALDEACILITILVAALEEDQPKRKTHIELCTAARLTLTRLAVTLERANLIHSESD